MMHVADDPRALLARALDQIGQASLDWAQKALRPEFRGGEADGKAFGPEVPVGADAPVYDRLAAFFGRAPG